jgi:hypothetical protein
MLKCVNGGSGPGVLMVALEESAGRATPPQGGFEPNLLICRSAESVCSLLVGYLRKIGARSFSDLFKALGDVCCMFAADECWNYLHAAGYVSD